jgi:ABC-2 type transport system permease protein
MLRWELTSLRLWLPVEGAIVILSGTGLVLGIGLFVPHLPVRYALYVTTGSAVVTLIVIGLIFSPQLIAQQKLAGTYQYLLSLPGPRSAAVLAWCSVTLMIGIPGACVALLVGMLRYGLTFTISPSIVPAVLLTALTGAMLGYAIGHAINRPMVTVMVSELFIFVAFGFAPVNFPATQMPAWLARLNLWLPFEPMATVVRAGLTTGLVTRVAMSWVVLSAWGLVACAAATAVIRRRP